jgi:hypothetical protein
VHKLKESLCFHKMKVDKILYCVIHSQMQEERYENIIKTWGKGCDLIFYSDHAIPEKKIIKVSDNTTYSSGEEKQINIINTFPPELLSYDWYFFCDNDTFVNTKKLNTFVNGCNPSKIYGKIGNTWPDDWSLHYFSGGAGFLMSNEVLKRMRGNLRHNNTVYGDVSIGINIRDMGIDKVHSDLFKSHPPAESGVARENIINYVTFHYIKTFDQMNDLYTICNK